MQVRHGIIKIDLGNEEYISRSIYDLYEKVDGNYREYLLNKSHYIEGFIEDDKETITLDVEEEEYKVYPGSTLDHVLSKLPSSNFEWTKPLTEL